MAIDKDIASLSRNSYKESTSTPNQSGVIVINPDGSNINSSAQTAGENHLGSIGGQLIPVAVTLTRPADTAPYAALDAISDSTSSPTIVFAFTNLLRIAGGSGTILKGILRSNNKLNTGVQFRLHLFRVAPTAINDNSPYTMLDANTANTLGVINFNATYTEDPTGSTGVEALANIGDGSNVPLVVNSSTRTIYGLLQTLTGFTPISGQTFYIELSLDAN